MLQKKFHIITMGCKVNQYESESVREAWLKSGHCEIDAPEGADYVLINSCAITAKAVSDLRNITRRVKKASPNCLLYVTGCAAQALPDELKELPVDEFILQSEKIQLLTLFDKPRCDDSTKTIDNGGDIASPYGSISSFWDEAVPEETIIEVSDGLSSDPTEKNKRVFPKFSVSDYKRSRAVLKIHDGCSQHCTYCIVPQGRGPSVSRAWPDLVAEAGRLVNAGFKEIVLNGINLRQYGRDLPGKPDFWDLLLRLERAFWGEAGYKDGGLRFRISSLEPGQLDKKALDVLGESKLIAPQLHLSLQSCSQDVLKKMGRGHYDPHTLPEFLDRLRDIWPVFGLGADFITGFPGETDADFNITMDLCSKLPLTYAHVFPYSERPGTAAVKMPNKVPQTVKKERALALRSLIEEKQSAFLKSQLSLSEMWIVYEGEKDRGVNEFYTECKIIAENSRDFLSEKYRSRDLIRVSPIGIEKNILLVKPNL